MSAGKDLKYIFTCGKYRKIKEIKIIKFKDDIKDDILEEIITIDGYRIIRIREKIGNKLTKNKLDNIMNKAKMIKNTLNKHLPYKN